MDSKTSEIEEFISAKKLADLLNPKQSKGIAGAHGATVQSFLLALAYPLFKNKRGVLWLLENNPEAQNLEQLTRFWLAELGQDVPVSVFSSEDESVKIISSYLQKTPQIVFSPLTLAVKKCLPSPADWQEQSITIQKDGEANLSALKMNLASLGYERNKQAGQEGEFSIRGEIIDVFPGGAHGVSRIVMKGNNIESISRLDPQIKKAAADPDQILIPPIKSAASGRFSLIDHLPEETLVIIHDPDELNEILSKKEELELRRIGEKHQTFTFWSFPAGQEQIVQMDIKSAPYFLGKSRRFLSYIRKLKAQKYKIIFLTRQKKRLENSLKKVFSDSYRHRLLDCPAKASGFIWDQAKIAVLTDREIFIKSSGTRLFKNKELDSDFLTSIKEGDLVVHLDHGIGRFIGMRENILEGIKKEYFCLEYAEEDKLFVPVETAEKLSKYVGEANPAIHRLHGGSWHHARLAARKSTLEFARQLLGQLAKRELAKAEALTTASQEENDLGDSFAWEETPDQKQAIDQALADLGRKKPMDRLIVGDVGFGKTEIAVRAAFKAVMNGKQAAVLAPTTVLAQQHFDTFSMRLKDFPSEIALLSRFQSRKEQKKILAGLKRGIIDIVIGTHRLLQKDVEFSNLGLAIIDEEQRFGVKQKENLKNIHPGVHILTLTATPIPRTLHLSLSGIRDISVIKTPPIGRLAIETIIHPLSEEMIKQAIEEEISRKGQVYYLHNDVVTIIPATKYLQKIVPRAKIDFAHGQMPEDKLMEVFKKFDNKKIDVLVATTIIENGLDLPNVNTLIVEEATQFGLAQLYQLRGRIGRSERQAYAYFFYKSQKLSGDAKKRLRALLEAKELGSGYELAMRDLEIRGIGNILGAEQHGNACAIGLHLYSSLLEQAILELKTGEKPEPIRDVPIDLPLEIGIPEHFDPDQTKRLKIYQHLSKIRKVTELKESAQLLVRKKEPPEPLKNLFDLLEIRILTQQSTLASIDTYKKTEDGITKKIVVFKYLQPLLEEKMNQLDKISDQWSLGNFQIKISLDQLGKNWVTKIKQIVNIFRQPT